MKGIKTVCLIALSTLMLISSRAKVIAMDYAKVTGTLSYPQLSGVLVEGAIIYVTLVDVSPREDSSGSIISRLAIANPSQSPLRFELKYNLTQINHRHTYAIQARIANQGKVILTNNLPYPVITRGNPHSVDVMLTTS